MHTLKSFVDHYGSPDDPGQAYAKPRTKKKSTFEQNLTMGTVKQVDLGGHKVNPYQKPEPPSKTSSEVVKRMAPGK